MKRRFARQEKIDFLLENNHFKKLHLALYLGSVFAIGVVYFLTIFLFSKIVNMSITAIFSILLGLVLVFHRDKLVRKLSDYIDEKKRKQYKEENHKGLKTTLRKVGPKKRDLKFNVKGKIPFKERIYSIKKKFSKSNDSDYIEVK